MSVFFRVDASLQIGTGHVMRCLTLADALSSRGAECGFICRAHPGNLIEFIRKKGYHVHSLPSAPVGGASMLAATNESLLAHATWVGVSQREDALECAVVLSEQPADCLILDHYGLDACWETELKPYYRKLLVIDDLADRPHQCDLLLDQTFARNPADYQTLVPADCTLLCGSQYALLRPEFASLRDCSLQRRKGQPLGKLLITMGGVDKDNATGEVLRVLHSSKLPADCHITVVMGPTAPWLAEVRQLAEEMPWTTTVRVGVDDMAQLMADSDLAIGAAGSTSWERCCLGLPTIMLLLAENQTKVAQELELAGAVKLLKSQDQVLTELPVLLDSLVSSPSLRQAMSMTAAGIVDGGGVARIIGYLGY
jgi:UDP-2,4-diacetamido-2,4,6-trideoxy-beta-L-altropyranose hydrolase